LHAAAQDAAAEEARHDAAEEPRHTTAEEAAQADTPRETEHDTPGDTHTPPDTDNPAEIQAAPDTPAPDTPAPDNVAHTGTMSGPSSGMDPSVTSIPPQHQQHQVSCPPLSLDLDQEEGVVHPSPSVHYL